MADVTTTPGPFAAPVEDIHVGTSLLLPLRSLYSPWCKVIMIFNCGALCSLSFVVDVHTKLGYNLALFWWEEMTHYLFRETTRRHLEAKNGFEVPACFTEQMAGIG